MKALSLHQPWASLIAVGAKRVETRDWMPPQRLLGERLAIHATKQTVVFPDTPKYAEFNRAVARWLGPDWTDAVPRGAVVAVATLAKARRVLYPHDIPEGDEALFGEYGLDRWMWLLEDVTPEDPPIPARGRQGIWNWKRPGQFLTPADLHPGDLHP